MLGCGYWTRQFGADSVDLNAPLTVNGTALTVIGVERAARGLYGVPIGATPDIFIPITMHAQMSPEDRAFAGHADGSLARNSGAAQTGDEAKEGGSVAAGPIMYPFSKKMRSS